MVEKDYSTVQKTIPECFHFVCAFTHRIHKTPAPRFPRKPYNAWFSPSFFRLLLDRYSFLLLLFVYLCLANFSFQNNIPHFRNSSNPKELWLYWRFSLWLNKWFYKEIWQKQSTQQTAIRSQLRCRWTDICNRIKIRKRLPEAITSKSLSHSI